ncbi:MAG: hypothetical protein ACE361_25630 [Aureliella sp.]
MTNETKILPNVGIPGLRALADADLAPKTQSRLDELLSRNSEGDLSERELSELDAIINQIDELNLLKARAAYTLQQQDKAKEQ